MATRRIIVRETSQQAGKRVYKSIVWAYNYWMVGLIIGAIGLKPSSMSVGGLSVTIERPEIIQGIIYLGALAYSLDALVNFQPKVNPFSRPDALRNFIWAALPKGTRSFRGMGLQDFVRVRTQAKFTLGLLSTMTIAFASIPVILIVLFNIRAVVVALGTIIGLA
jgi:hypothetical protein